MAEREEKSERRRARRVLERGGDEEMVDEAQPVKAVDAGADERDGEEEEAPRKANLLTDSRFAKLFQDEDFEVDETSREFQSINPSTNPSASFSKGLTAVEQEQLDGPRGSDSEESSDDEEESRPQQRQQSANSADKNRVSSSNYRKAGHRSQRPQMLVSSSTASRPQQRRDRSFGSRAASLKDNGKRGPAGSKGAAVGEKEVTFAPARVEKAGRSKGNEYAAGGGQRHERKDRRSASGNVFRRM
ncbi:Small ribosomal subunit biogenesis [Coniosporium tulheliwenetii]|uniref:Small ribosomal subunit biogenesis n=1 Tax=Coniosporium tulheliwenetii TaxID=3383036 RepID=A0ACC2YZ90_9PEZI|nr:Small ribosomal subunit biogenesis [Cladosporium sp. JES 115]